MVYKPSTKPGHAQAAERLRESELLDRTVSAVNDLIALPANAAVLVTDCGRIDTYYDPKAPGIVVCHELMVYLRQLFGRSIRDPEVLDRAVLGATFFAFLHELGHALVDQLELPVTGKEEDAVDQLATVILVRSGGKGLGMALDGAHAFLLLGKSARGSERTAFWDEHSFEQQRYYAITCLVYGSDPKGMAKLLGRDGLPESRARQCPAEYARIDRAWRALLAEHGKAE